jgi:hypothetical protein
MDVRAMEMEWAAERLPTVEQNLLFLRDKLADEEWLKSAPTQAIQHKMERVRALNHEVSYLRGLLGISTAPRKRPVV